MPRSLFTLQQTDIPLGTRETAIMFFFVLLKDQQLNGTRSKMSVCQVKVENKNVRGVAK